MLGFLYGEFRQTRDHEMNEQRALGWSATFMKCGLAAFLLFFLEEETLQNGCIEMCRKITETISFDSKLYYQGTGHRNSASGEKLFWKLFVKWKKTMAIPEEEHNGYLEWMKQLIQKRVDGIMNANRRNYYDECAAYIAALGEVMESRGEKEGKQRVMREFMQQYSRRNSFRKALKSYGMML